MLKKQAVTYNEYKKDNHATIFTILLCQKAKLAKQQQFLSTSMIA